MHTSASGVHYLPDVTREMSAPSYWTQENELLMPYEDIEALNEKTISASGTNMYDLENMPEIVDGIALNESLIKSSTADAEYYLGKKYFESDEKATQEDFDLVIANTQNPDAETETATLYGIATRKRPRF